eukprot:4842953-Amphidinium_carterae.3
MRTGVPMNWNMLGGCRRYLMGRSLQSCCAPPTPKCDAGAKMPETTSTCCATTPSDTAKPSLASTWTQGSTPQMN